MNKTAIVTGGSKRIGRSISLKLADMDYNIALHYNTSLKEAEETRDFIKSKGVSCKLFHLDLSRPQGIEDFMVNIFNEFNDVELLVNNASVFRETGFRDVTLEQFSSEFNINFVSPFFITQQFSKLVEEGMIINLVDARITKVHTAHFVYNLTKKAMRDLTLMTAKTLGPEIRVNAICPGPILPPPGENESYIKQIAEKTPLKLTGGTQYIDSAVQYLIENTFLTGELLFVDGGEHL